MKEFNPLLEQMQSFSPNARIWIYQSDREFVEQELNQVEQSVSSFAQSWQVHGTKAKALGTVLFARFILFIVDDSTPASGCSIDASVKFIQMLENQYQIQLMNRSQIAYIDEDNQIKLKDFKTIKKQLKEGILSTETILFNNTIQTLKELDGDWMIPAKESWLY